MTAEDVDAWFAQQDHSMTDAARAVRDAILRAAPGASQSVKWQAPNFATSDDFATFSMRRPGVLQVVLHTGARPRPELPPIEVSSLGGRARRAGHNRVVITLTSPEDVADVLPELEETIRIWAASV
jgi:hypothetical protein